MISAILKKTLLRPNRQPLIKNPEDILKVELLKTAKQLYDEGYGILLFDFRNHGESDSGNNGNTAGVKLISAPGIR
jgi:hypothetical protein